MIAEMDWAGTVVHHGESQEIRRRGSRVAIGQSVEARRETGRETPSPLAAVDTDSVRASIEDAGYAIVHDVVAPADIAAMRNFWIADFARCENVAPLVWGPYLGEANGAMFDRRAEHCVYRSFDYLWNPPYHRLTREVGLALNRVRNRIVGNEERYGELFAEDRYGIYVTTSYYPPGEGRMQEHGDGTGGRIHWHYILPLTFRGPDYDAGGLYLTDRRGVRVDVDAGMRAGSVLFFDGQLRHGVEPIVGRGEDPVGRLQMFAIPVLFEAPERNQRLMQLIPVSTFARSKLSRLKRRLKAAVAR